MLDRATNAELLRELDRRLAGDEPNPDKEAGRHLARQFARLYDEAQADFFEEVAQLFHAWGPLQADTQLFSIARHMRRCACVTARGREWVRELAAALGKEGEE